MLSGKYITVVSDRYSWIKEKVNEGSLCPHGGYNDFVNCTFEKCTLTAKKTSRGKQALDAPS
uniref:Uncharacterized protein n=1 Tax=Kalanchoe fedtschenkoi TaxID=63787 RepID=A0A7N0UQY6_KALFE